MIVGVGSAGGVLLQRLARAGFNVVGLEAGPFWDTEKDWDGSIMPTQGSANPGLTIQALAARTADYLISQGSRIFSSDERDMTEPGIRRELAPPATWGKGVPRLV